ncbi:MAG: hypothetical protein JRN62_09500 [Nitrososphaerota archaeon]|nr:hypothetical protein [Nitrososphaerota archaeon]
MNITEINSQFAWPLASKLKLQASDRSLYKQDDLLEHVEDLVLNWKAWCPTEGATKRVEPEEKITNWIREQMAHQALVARVLRASREVALRTGEFPRADDSTRVITTARSIVYLIDTTSGLIDCLSAGFGKSVASRASSVLDSEIPACLFVSNSIESGGRAFSGDPFTGQIAAFSRIMCHDMESAKIRNFVAYYPHQLYSQFFQRNGKIRENKGIKIIESNVDLVITAGGVLLGPRDWGLI